MTLLHGGFFAPRVTFAQRNMFLTFARRVIFAQKKNGKKKIKRKNIIKKEKKKSYRQRVRLRDKSVIKK